jgi:hypothetical protein
MDDSLSADTSANITCSNLAWLIDRHRNEDGGRAGEQARVTLGAAPQTAT